MALDRSGRIVLAGSSGIGEPDFAVSRLLPDGTPDRSFGGTGSISLDLAPGAPDVARDVLVDTFGRIVLAGARLLPLGNPDRSFSDDSRIVTGFGRWSATASTIVGFPSGDVAIAGSARRTDTSHHDFVIARYSG